LKGLKDPQVKSSPAKAEVWAAGYRFGFWHGVKGFCFFLHHSLVGESSTKE